MTFGAVVIGLNEGDRLKQCIRSLAGATPLVYVDSGSTDGSADWARRAGATVVALDLTLPFTAARARNAGFRQLKEIAPDTAFVQFVDGDCELRPDWPAQALAFLQAHPDAAAVCGRLRERFPDRSVYNWLCDQEWDGPAGETRAFGGNVMLRAPALAAMGGYRDSLIAGEEPELCVRLRAAGWRIWRLENEMGLHDADIIHFSQWWRRALRGGYAFAEGAHLHGDKPGRHFVWEARRALIWGVGLPLCCLIATLAFPPAGSATWAIFPLQAMRQTLRNTGPLKTRARLALFLLIARFPEGLGHLRFLRDRWFSRRARIIEYK
jgi:glycosyltransferase involved in cell wall biosynthesis